MVNLDFRYEAESHKKLLDITYFSTRKLSFSIFKNVMLIPATIKGKSGGVYNQDGSLIDETALYLECGLEHVDLKDIQNPVDTYSDACIYMGVYEPCWGHFITDCLKKIWFIKSNSYSQFNNCRLVFLSPKNTKLGGNHRRLLELLGVDVSKIVVCTKNTLANELIIPDSSFFYDETFTMHYTKEYSDTINFVKNLFKDEGKKEYEKIYYSYSSFKKKGFKKTFGEEKLDKFFKDRGFLIIHPEQHSLDEQLVMLANCKCFASTEGSSSHNSLFLKDNTEVIIIPRGPYFSGYQQTIDSIGEFNINYVDSALSAFTSKNGPWSGPNYFYVSEELMEYFKLSPAQKSVYRKTNFKDMKKYLTYNCVDLAGRNYYIQNIYSEKFFHYLSLNSKKIFPGHYLKMKISHFFEKIRSGSKHS